MAHPYRLDTSVGAMPCDLTKHNVPWGIVTNGSANQRETIHAFGFDKLTSCVVISGLANVRKPEPEIFLQALSLLSVDPDRDVLFAGDNPIADIGAVHAIGLSTEWVRRGREWTEPTFASDHQIDRISELAPFLMSGRTNPYTRNTPPTKVRPNASHNHQSRTHPAFMEGASPAPTPFHIPRSLFA